MGPTGCTETSLRILPLLAAAGSSANILNDVSAQPIGPLNPDYGTDVSGQSIGPINTWYMTNEDGTDVSGQSIGPTTPWSLDH